jgi:nitroimidazol reductase NimA-like FMN-containing flavoprotein (pyridoxamine 5'-phosphate oxidase superfamily)
MSQFTLTDKNRVRRVPKRGVYDREIIFQIIDQALVGHVGFVINGDPFVIPTLVARCEEQILLHGATSSRLMRHVAAGGQLSISISHVDALVLARSVFHHSINYRSAVLFGCGQIITDRAKKLDALKCFTERLVPGRWADARRPNEEELKATAIAAVKIDLASAKIRTGPPVDDAEDYALPIWAGVVPVRRVFDDPVADHALPADTAVPSYLEALVNDSAKD